MCTRAFVMLDGKWQDASTRGELRAMLGVEPIFDPLPDPNDHDCLCNCDVDATAALAGYAVARDDIGDYELKKAD